MSLAITYADKISIVETIGQNVGGALPITNTITHTAFDKSAVLNGATAPLASQCALFVASLVAGALNIDLTNLLGTNAGAINGTGLRLQILRVENIGANSMTLAQGASNPCAIGTGIVIPPGGHVKLYFNTGLAPVSPTAKILTITGTGTQQANITTVLG